jgi:hypothetical protein
MYIDPNVGGMLFQAFATIFAVVTGLVFVFSRQIRSGIARIRRHFRKSGKTSTEDGKIEE